MFYISTSENYHIEQDAHYISWALESGLGYAFAHTMEMLGLNYADTMNIFIMINAKCETATMYPKANITIMPNGQFGDKIIYNHFNDAMKAQNLYIHAKKVIFDMRNYCYNHVHGNGEYIEMIKHSYDIMKIMCNKENDVEDWIVLCSGNEKLPTWATKYLISDANT